MANKYGYQVHKQNVSESTDTRHATIDIIRLEPKVENEIGFRGDRVLTLEWQASRFPDADGTPRYWYGCSFVPQKLDSLSAMKELTSLARKLMPIEFGWFSFGPERFLEACESKKIRRIYYDSRLSRYLSLKDIPDLSLDRWMALDAKGYCTVDCLAKNEDEAKRQLLVQMAESAGAGPYHSDYDQVLRSWLDRDKPVKNASFGSWGQSAPVVEETSELLKLDETETADTVEGSSEEE